MDALNRKRVLGFGFGEAATQAVFAAVSALLLTYYTDVVAMNAAIAGTVLMVVRVADACFDLGAGRVMDTTSTRWGRFRPFLLLGGLPLSVTGVLLFLVPDLDPGLQVAYAAGTFALFGVAYAFSQVALGSLAAAMTRTASGRDRLARARSMASFLVYLPLFAVVIPAMEGAEDLGAAQLAVVGGAAAVSAVLFVAAFAMTRESVRRPETRVGWRESLVAVRRNPPLLVLCAGMLLMLIGFETFNFGTLYYARFLLGGFDSFILMSIPMAIGQGLFSWLTPRLTRRYGKRRTYIAAGLAAACGYAALFLTPPGQLWLVLAVLTLSASGAAVVETVIWSMQADTVEYGQWRSGHRAEGAIYAFFSFARKGGNAIASGLAGVVLAGSGYVAGTSDQPASAQWGILALVGLIPATAYTLSALCMRRYRLTEAEHRRIVERLDTVKEKECSSPSAS